MVVFDGYDIVIYGNVISSLQDEWGISSSTAGTLGSLCIVGMMFGALVAGRLADAIGRRRAVLGCVALFSVATVFCALATGPVMFGITRLIAGLGLGGLVPTANTLAAELVPDRVRAAVATLMMSGAPIGGVVAALLGRQVIPAWGWRPMFWFALVALVVLLPLGLRFLPKDERAVRGSRAGAGSEVGEGFRAVLSPRYRTASILFALVTVATLLAWYGLGTWLPKLMQDGGADLGSALTFALALNLGAVAGSFLTAWAGVRFGPIRTGVVTAGLAGIGLLLLLTEPPTGVIYLIIVIAGIGTHGTQCLVIAAVASRYPEALRGTALGWTLGIGRIGAVMAPQMGGWLLSGGAGASGNFIFFGTSALVAAALLLVILRNARSSAPVAIAA
ncbi:MFS transporter [Tsukamurella spumae]|nr:aromatic acid/H+ symport family MFS transporter [Tsukamurella spumae]